jgi:hypothetical protein
MIDGYTGADEVAAQWQRFKRQIAPLETIPFVPVPGNHDLYNAERRSDLALEALYRAHWGPTWRHFEYRNALFVILNSDAPGAERSIGPDQWRWLEETLDGSDAEHVFVFLHRPPASLETAEDLHDLLRRYPVRYVFFGHQHHYEHVERDGIRYVMTNAAADTAVPIAAVGGYDHLLLVTVRDAAAGYAVIAADSIQAPDSAAPEDNQALFDLSRELVAGALTMVATDGGYRLRLGLDNPTARSLTAYVSCGSADDRWRFEPAAVPAVILAPGAGQTVELDARYDVPGPPETLPVCRIQVPYLTRFGEWVPFEVESTATPP